MVDAINNIKNPVQPVKDVSINWKSCTAEEIIDYKGQGQDVPAEFLRWAQDMAKVQGAPDDITYEMAFGKTDGTAEIDNSNTAAGLQNGLNTQGVSIIDQAKIFANTDNNYSLTIQNYINEIDTLIENSTNSVAEAETQKNNILEKVQTLLNKQDQIKASNSEGTNKAGEIANLDAQIQALGNLGIQNTRQAGAPITQAGAAFEEGTATSKAGLDFGNQTLPIAEQLISQGQQGYMFSPEYVAGINALDAANNVIGTSQKGTPRFEDAKGDNAPNANKLTEFTNEIARTAHVTSTEAADTNETTANEPGAKNTNNQTQSNKAETTQNTNNAPKVEEETDKTGQAKDDTEVTTDPNEILKRKERRGIV